MELPSFEDSISSHTFTEWAPRGLDGESPPGSSPPSSESGAGITTRLPWGRSPSYEATYEPRIRVLSAPVVSTSYFRGRGNRCCIVIADPRVQAKFAETWHMRAVSSVALHRGFIIIFDDGSASWWDIPEALDRKLRSNSIPSALDFAALGPNESFFLRETSGRMHWRAPRSFAEAVRNGFSAGKGNIERVAFGPKCSWIIVWGSGTIDYESIPESMATTLDELGRRWGVVNVNLGMDNEWFVLFKNHAVRSDHLSESVFQVVKALANDGARLRDLAFGSHGAFFIRFWDEPPSEESLKQHTLAAAAEARQRLAANAGTSDLPTPRFAPREVSLFQSEAPILS